MATNPNLKFRRDLTDHAFAIMPDYLKVLDEAKGIAPIVATGALAGRYMKFNAQQGFAAPRTKRAAGGQTAEAKFAGEWVDFVLDPNALKISVDQEIELPFAGDNANLLEEAKVETMLAQGTQAFAAGVYTLLKSSVSAHATYGKWGDNAVDPIDEIDQLGLAIFAATGLYPNMVDITPQMLSYLRKSAATLARFPAKSGAVTPDMIAGELSWPAAVRVITGAGLSGGGFGNDSATFVPLLGTACWAYHTNPLATGMNPSFAINLAQTRELISGVYEYMNDEGTVKWLRIKWAVKTVVQSTSLCGRIDYQA